MSDTAIDPNGPNPPATFLGHPRGLFLVFMVEMWERFSYYGMRGLLVFYLTKHFLFADKAASLTYGAYTSMVFLTPVAGGWIADRWLGGRKSVLFGATMIACGHGLLAIEGAIGGTSAGALDLFYFGLGSVIVGTGFVKANISSIVGTLYPRDDRRRDPAYTIFYMGVNLGGFLGALVCGWLGERVGWTWGFGAAGLGMVAGLILFASQRHLLLGRSEPPNPGWLRERPAGLPREAWIYTGGVASVALAWLLVQNQALVGTLLAVAGPPLVAYILWFAIRTLPPVERDRIFAAVALILGSIVFWAFFEQAGSSINLYTDRNVDRTLFGWNVPASMFQSINSFWIIAMAPVLAGIWTWLGRKGWEPSAPAKFGLGMIQLGLGFLVLVWGARANPGVLTPSIYIVLLYLLHSTGELSLSPVGLSAMTKLALPQMFGLLMGTWFFATATGEYLAGVIAALTGGVHNDGGAATITIYSRVGWLAIGVGVLFIIVAPWFKRLMHLDTLREPAHDLAGKEGVAQPDAAGAHIDRELK
ncbi:POT family proton-dependent oligopeptide transporter [Sphingomonas vulcanisoli]|uniref:POT family proton-dependent oligopeptide transporter n=1 Tax=Sphingomonas vulcanisoli TaxID=1658060 RepID=A0ABX0TW35_9SPHN|nr:peptide MFS transporter [Sphingomonas vulcanisoli]NIJ07811.1 POT family proton-dependent oligopeptide transporter [Sphingomonas vulcanisoli]